MATYQPDRDKVARLCGQSMLGCGQLLSSTAMGRWRDRWCARNFPVGRTRLNEYLHKHGCIRNSGMLRQIIREPKSPDELEELFPNHGKREPMRGQGVRLMDNMQIADMLALETSQDRPRPADRRIGGATRSRLAKRDLARTWRSGSMSRCC